MDSSTFTLSTGPFPNIRGVWLFFFNTYTIIEIPVFDANSVEPD